MIRHAGKKVESFVFDKKTEFFATESVELTRWKYGISGTFTTIYSNEIPNRSNTPKSDNKFHQYIKIYPKVKQKKKWKH